VGLQHKTIQIFLILGWKSIQKMCIFSLLKQ
jgi:hypothetical protein